MNLARITFLNVNKAQYGLRFYAIEYYEIKLKIE